VVSVRAATGAGWSGREGERIVSLLRVDPELGEELVGNELATAEEELLVRVETLEWERREGRWGPADASGFFGLIVVGGLLLREVDLGRGHSAELLGAGDLLRPWDVDGTAVMPQGEAAVGWTVLRPVEVAVLDRPFLERACGWPPVLSRLSTRAVLRAKSVLLDQAISHLKRVESRLLLLFWHLAERWGRRGLDAITLDLPLTHEVLARLVGSTRPSVTTALGRLARRGLLERADGRWRLSPDAGEQV
jgi:CRP-like cAMP-binding protein